MKSQLKTCLTQQGILKDDGLVSKAFLKDAFKGPVNESKKNHEVQNTESDYDPSESSQDDGTYTDEEDSMVELVGDQPVPLVELIDSFLAEFNDVDFNERVNAQYESLKQTLIEFRGFYEVVRGNFEAVLGSIDETTVQRILKPRVRDSR